MAEDATIEKPAKLADVARAAGVSQGTVSNVFNRPELVREEVRAHVREVAGKLGYRGADPRGRLLRAGKVNAIGVATVEPLSYFFNDPFARELMAGVSEACDAAGAGIALVSAQSEEGLAWNIQSALVDGFILFCIEGGARLVELTRERQLPFVALLLDLADPTIPGIGIDNVAGARMAARHLAERGHQRFAILSLPLADGPAGRVSMTAVHAATYSTSRDRIAGYFAGLSDFGIDTSAVPMFDTQDKDDAIAAALGEIFAAPVPPTAILAMSDRIALVALKWLAARGLSVPGDVSVVGFDGVPEGARSEPPLTTIAQPIAEIGRRAVAAILQPAEGVRRQTLEVSLVVRGSSGPVRR